MARKEFCYAHQLQPTAENQAMILLAPAADHPVALRAIELQPLGATGASAPIMLDFASCADTTGMTDDSSSIVKLGNYSEDIKCSAYKYNNGNPGSPSRLWTMTLHQQGGAYKWTPALLNNEYLMPGNTKYHVRWCTTQTGITYRVIAWCEE